MPQPTKTMFFLPYVPRADSDLRGYDDWIRKVDNPFFNGVDGISLYVNWKVVAVLRGEIDFTHVDFMYVDPAKEAAIWNNPAVSAFAQAWTNSWGRDPGNADLSMNYHVYRLEQDVGVGGFNSEQVTVLIQPAGPVAPGATRWRVAVSVLGHSRYTVIDVIYGPAPAAALDGAVAAFTCEIIAAP